MTHFCGNCGAQLRNPEALFCPTCGHPQQSGDEQPHLLLQMTGRPLQRVTLNRLLRIGRDPANDLVLPLGAVSRRHAQIEPRDDHHYVRDLDSTNGTYVNNQRLSPDQWVRLNPGDVIRIGDEAGNNVRLEFNWGGQEEHEAPPHPKPGTVQLTPLPTGRQDHFTIGRAAENDLVLPHPAVSRRHAEIRQGEQGPLLYDLHSQNGTFVNGHRVTQTQPLREGDTILVGPYKVVYGREGTQLLDPHGNFRIDAQELERIVVKEPGPGERVKNLLFGEKTERKLHILKKIDISIHPREFVALVGSSGAGKSTLMKALSGVTPADGRVFVNGDDLYANFAAYRHILGYVPQDDIIHGLLPVRDALRYSAQLRLPDLTRPEIEDRINRVLRQVEMTEHAGKQISSLSGGQRKRVSIAVELLAEPFLFFLDEPTSGLDPGLEKKMMFMLRKLADEGRTIVLVTHATANIEQCTHVAFMADGHMPYFGPPQDARTFFITDDFADIYTRLSQPLDGDGTFPEPLQPHLEALRTEKSEDEIRASDVWNRYFRQSEHYVRYVQKRGGHLQGAANGQPGTSPRREGQRVNQIEQFKVLARRYSHLIRRDVMSLFILLAVMPIVGFLLLVMTDQHDLVGSPSGEVSQTIQAEIAEAIAGENRRVDDETFSGTYTVASSAQRLLFMLALAANLLGLFAAAYEIIKEESIYRRERMINLKIGPYLLSKYTVLALFALLQALLLLIVVGIKVEYPQEGVFLPPVFEIYITLVLATMAGIGLGLLISALVENHDMVIYVVLVVLFIQIMFAGAIFELPAVARPISRLTPTRWTLEALGSIVDLPALNAQGVTCVEFEDENTQRMMSDAESPCKDGQLKQEAAVDFNVAYEPAFSHLLLRWFVLALFSLSAGAGTYYVQKRKDVLG